MAYTIIIGLISIVPGLGFILFRRYRQAVFSFVSVVGLLLFSVFSSWEGLNELIFIMALYFWYLQISMAIRMAQAIKFSNNELTSASIENIEEIQIPPDLSRQEKMVFRTGDYIVLVGHSIQRFELIPDSVKPCFGPIDFCPGN